MGKIEPMENSHLWFSECRKVTTHKCPSINVNGNRISVLAIMKKLKNGHHFVNIDHTENFKLLTPQKFGSLVFWVSTEMEYQCQPLWKNWKMASLLWISIIRKNFKLLAPQSLGLWLSKCQCLKHLCMNFMHSDLSTLRIQRCKFSVDSIFWTFCWFSFPHHPS